MKKFRAAVRIVGLSVVAKRVGTSPQAVTNWIARGQVPVAQCASVVAALDGRVGRADLRPFDWKAIWPDAA